MHSLSDLQTFFPFQDYLKSWAGPVSQLLKQSHWSYDLNIRTFQSLNDDGADLSFTCLPPFTFCFKSYTSASDLSKQASEHESRKSVALPKLSGCPPSRRKNSPSHRKWEVLLLNRYHCFLISQRKIHANEGIRIFQRLHFNTQSSKWIRKVQFPGKVPFSNF